MTRDIDSSAAWEAERERLNTEIQRLEAALIRAKEVTPDDTDQVHGEYSLKLREAERELEEASERWRVERKRLNSDVDRLEEDLRKARAEGRSADVLEAEKAAKIRDIEIRAKEELDAAAENWKSERWTLESRLEELNGTVAGSESKVAEIDALREELLSRLSESEIKRSELEEALTTSKAAADREQSTLKQQLEESERKSRAEAGILETEIREKLSMEYEWKIKELAFQKEQLEQKLKEPVSNPGPEAGTFDSDVAAEIAHVDEQVNEILRFIDDPSSALSTVIRKNVERSELEAYRQGLAFRSGHRLEKAKD